MRQPMTLGLGCVVVCAILIWLPTMAWAQGTSAAGIVGTARDSSGAVLPGVTVEAASPALIEKVRATITDERGEYRIIELRPGTYSVTFTLPGFSTFKREGLDLPSSFTATVNAELRVGALAETVTVSGETPLVDIQNVTSQKAIPKAVLDAVPTGKGIYGFVSLMPAAITPATNQDVGGSLGDSTVRITVHGSKPSDQKLLMDGLSYNIVNANGTARQFFVNPLAAQEIVIDTGSGGTAEWGVGGAIVNLISRDGGNTFSGTIFASGMTDAMQGNNLTDALRSQGLRSVNKSLGIYDANIFIGGPLKRDTLWFASAHRRHGQSHRVANLYEDANLAARTFGAPAAVWRYAPDYSRPVEPTEDNQAHGIRLTWQATPKDKITVSYDWQWNRNQNNIGNLNTGTLAWEANSVMGQYRCGVDKLLQGTWVHPATSRLLFEAGANYMNHRGGIFEKACYVTPDRINIRDVGLNFVYNGVGEKSRADRQFPINQRFSTTFVAGAHNLKVGMLALETLNPYLAAVDRGEIPFTYTFNNGVPTGLTQWVSPLEQNAALRLSLGVFVQDQWKIDRLTLNAGLRYEYVNAYAPALERQAGPLQDAASFPEVDCLPCWHDLYPRLSGVYDLFGNGRTAVKASIGRYGAATTTLLAENYRPVTAAVNSTTRSWTDANGNFFPECDLRNPLANGECAAMANRNFGQIQVRSRPDPDWITGWGNRGYNWQASAGIDHELIRGVGVSASYFRTWFGNFTVTDNQLLTPADYDPYCITAPTDSRLGSISGQQLCKFYDIKPEKFGLVDTVERLAKHYGKYTEYYNGVDVSLSARLPNGALLAGGWNVGNTVSLIAGTGFISNKVNRCFVVDSPQELFNCETANPYQHRIKLNGSYPLPWDLQAAFVFQNLPGSPYSVASPSTSAGTGGGAILTLTTAQIAPSLGRNLSGNTRTVSIDLLPPYGSFVDQRINQVDLRLSKIFRAGKVRYQGNLDLYNALNASTVLQVQQQYSETWLQPTQIMPARLFKLGVQLDF